jgi:chemotaxis protein MotB
MSVDAQMDATEHECEECEPGAPQWMATFADLSTLLMSFFVLLLAFSEMDVNKFKQLSGSMKNAFGVQADIDVKTMPKGTSIITREFRPGRPAPSPIDTVRQYTIHSNKSSLKWLENQGDAFQDIVKVFKDLKSDIEGESLSFEWDRDTITIHIRERASFDSGSADLKEDFIPVIHRIRDLVNDLPGDVKVEGHTDNIPISTSRFRSNWELSASRAVSVALEMLAGESLVPERMVVVGHADTMPVESNDTSEGRAANRRVDVTIERDPDRQQDTQSIADKLGAVLGKVEGGVVQLTLPESLVEPGTATNAGATPSDADSDAADVLPAPVGGGDSAAVGPIDASALPQLRLTPRDGRTERPNTPVPPADTARAQVYDEDI